MRTKFDYERKTYITENFIYYGAIPISNLYKKYRKKDIYREKGDIHSKNIVILPYFP
jgi:hypothetical protein